jgi:hypothetical protein
VSCLAMYTGSSARIHRREKLAGHRVRTAFMRRLPKVVLALPVQPARDDALSVPPWRPPPLPRYTGTLRKVCSHHVDSSLEPMFTPLRQRSRSSQLKAAPGSEPVPHMVLTHGTRRRPNHWVTCQHPRMNAVLRRKLGIEQSMSQSPGF